MSSLKNHKSILFTTIMCLVSTVLFAQDYNDYLLMAKQRLSEGNCEKAQENYRVYKELTGRTNDELEEQIAECFCDKVSETEIPVKPNTPPLYVTGFNVSQNGETLSDSEIRTLFANSKSYELYDQGMSLESNSRIPSDILCTIGGLMIGGGAILHGIKIINANGVGDMINSLDHGVDFIDLEGYLYEPYDDWGYSNPNNAAKRESLEEAQKQFVKESKNGLYIVAGGVTSIIVGVLWNKAIKASGRSKVRKAVDLYNNGQIQAQNDMEIKYGITGNKVYVTFLF